MQALAVCALCSMHMLHLRTAIVTSAKEVMFLPEFVCLSVIT